MVLSRKPAPGAGKRKGGTKRRVDLLKESSKEQTVQGPTWGSLKPTTFSRQSSDFPVGPRYYCCSVTKSCLTFCDPMDCSMPGCPVLHHLPGFAEIHIHRVSDAIQPSHLLSCPSALLLLPSVFRSFRVFSSELILSIRWANYCSFSFRISSSNEYLGLSGPQTLLEIEQK